VLVEDMSRNNICFTSYIHLWPIYCFSFVQVINATAWANFLDPLLGTKLLHSPREWSHFLEHPGQRWRADITHTATQANGITTFLAKVKDKVVLELNYYAIKT
jgi:hypothetical protein